MGNMKEWAALNKTTPKLTQKRPVGRPRKERFDDEGPEICRECRRVVTEHAPLCMSDLKPSAPDTVKPDTFEDWETSEGTHIMRIRHLAAGFKSPTLVGVIWKR